MSPLVYITGHINRKTEFCLCLLKSEQIKSSATEAMQREPYTGSCIHWLAQGQDKKTLAPHIKRP